jgi:hypothetical protein
LFSVAEPLIQSPGAAVREQQSEPLERIGKRKAMKERKKGLISKALRPSGACRGVSRQANRNIGNLKKKNHLCRQ